MVTNLILTKTHYCCLVNYSADFECTLFIDYYEIIFKLFRLFNTSASHRSLTHTLTHTLLQLLELVCEMDPLLLLALEPQS